MSEPQRGADVRLVHRPGESCMVYLSDRSFVAQYCRRCKYLWPCPAILDARNPGRPDLPLHEFEGRHRCTVAGCWRGRAAACHRTIPKATPEGEAETSRCAYSDFNTCRAQCCGNFKAALDGPPFCAECLAMLPDLVRRRLLEEWHDRPMVAMVVPVTVTRRFMRPRRERRSGGEFYEQDTGEKRAVQIYDVEAMAAKHRRLEVQAAWMLRAIRRL